MKMKFIKYLSFLSLISTLLSCIPFSQKIETKFRFENYLTTSQFTFKTQEKLFKTNTDPVLIRVNDLISHMTLDDKINYLSGTGFVEGKKIGETKAFKHLGIPAVKMTDATSGSKLTEDHILFPAFVCLAATFNPELSVSYGRAVAEQCKADGYRVLLGPGVNMYRVPHCGRNFEYLGEDPYLASSILVPYIKSVQKSGVIATVKHFVANNSEYYRKNSNSVVSERALHEIYFPAFKAAVQEANVKAVMTSYNLLNDEWVGQSNHLITGILRNEWGFDGMVMSDWWSINNTEKAITSGLDLEMPSARVFKKKCIKALLDKGIISEALIDQRLINILKPFCETGLFDEKHPDPSLRKNWPEHERIAIDTARQGIVLLKNQDHILPISVDATKKLAVIGKNAVVTSASGGGAGGFDPGEKLVTYLEAIINIASKDNMDVIYCDLPYYNIATADTVLIFLTMLEHECMDRPFDLSDTQKMLIRQTSRLNSNTIVVLSVGSGVEMASWIDDVKGLVYNWYPGTYGAQALAEILFGEINPSGKLPFSIEHCESDTHYYGNYLPEGTRLPREIQRWYHGSPNIDIHYREGIFTGYRWYDTKNIQPLFPFGFGLSYSEFNIDHLTLSSGAIFADETLTICCNIQNTSDLNGAEVIQLYIQDIESSESRPKKELKGFKRVSLKAHETKQVEMTIDKNDLSFWSEIQRDWQVEDGTFNVLVGTSSADINLKASFNYFYQRKD
jgi:beta-glucosidase